MSSLAGENPVFDTASISSGSDFGRDVDNLSIQSETELESDLEGDAKQLEEKVSQLDQTQVVHCNKWKNTITIVEKEQLDPSINQDDCKLMTLNLSHNSFREVPACLSCLAPHLARLHLSYNQLASVGPLARFPSSLKHLDLAHNQVVMMIMVMMIMVMMVMLMTWTWLTTRSPPGRSTPRRTGSATRPRRSPPS